VSELLDYKNFVLGTYMNFLKQLFIDGHGKRRAMWIALFMMLVASVFVFQSGKSNDEGFVEKKAEWDILSKEKQTIHLHWLRTLNPIVRNTDGDLIWNTDQQKGLMRFVNLPRLKDEQYYHLWVYDLNKSTEHPVLAGIFSGTKKSDNFYAPIEPEEEISLPFKFLLTIGKKGDKDFSKSESLLLAQP
jgi:hypothetical protein